MGCCYSQITMILSCIIVVLLFLHRFLLPWKWPLIKLMQTAYLRSHRLHDKITHVLAENNETLLFKTSWIVSNPDILLTSDPENAHHILNSNYSNYQRSAQFKRAFDFLGESVFIKDIETWREEKKIAHGYFKETQFQKHMPSIIHHILDKGLIPVLDHASLQNQELDLQCMFNRYMLDSTFLLATGFDLCSLRIDFPKSPLLDAMDDIAEAVFYRQILPERVWRLQKWLNVGKEKKLAEAAKTFNQILEHNLSENCGVDNRANNEDHFDVLNFYLSKLGIKDGSISSDMAFISSNMMSLLFAGRDTSGAILTWFFYLISQSPLIQDKILGEIRRNNPPPKHSFSNAQELSKMIYLHAALTESLRLYPTAPVLIRDPMQEDVLPSGHRVSPNTKIIICSYAMGRMKRIYGEDCMEFKPERWILSGNDGIKHVPPYKYPAFGSGPWACPGKDMAFTRLKAVVATVLHNYHVRVVEGQSISPSVSALLTMRDGLRATVSSRWM